MNALSDILGHVSPALAYSVLAGAVLAESVLLVGAFIPTLTLLLTAGALARTGHISLVAVITVAAGAVVAGDFLAHRTGRLLGGQLRAGPVSSRIPGATWRRAGPSCWPASCPWSAPSPPTSPAPPGCRTVAPYSVAAACLWATAEAGVGYAAASSLQRMLTLGGPALATVILIALRIALLPHRSRVVSGGAR
ncbi:DedA family protein [Streptomyces sp. YU58]|uniref:DedA family protein n=1 Tax=Streptomyces sp. SX92 TaxID=3158972 RepID=UPI0027BB0671|nr:DedA family protein [Streptomyces coralus]WLW57245.1 DedA family protein [Streptomyces coralus]